MPTKLIKPLVTFGGKFENSHNLITVTLICRCEQSEAIAQLGNGKREVGKQNDALDTRKENINLEL